MTIQEAIEKATEEDINIRQYVKTEAVAKRRLYSNQSSGNHSERLWVGRIRRRRHRLLLDEC